MVDIKATSKNVSIDPRFVLNSRLLLIYVATKALS